MRQKFPWYKRDVTAWRTGTRGAHWDLELRGFYSEFLDASWELQTQLPKDEKWLSLAFGVSTRLVRALLPRLMVLGKVIETSTGYYNPRMMADILGVEIVEPVGEYAPVIRSVGAPLAHDSHTSRALLVHESVTKNRNTPMITTREEREEKKREEKKPPTPLQGAVCCQFELGEATATSTVKKTCKPTKAECLEAFHAWNATAERCGLQQASKMTGERERKISARLKDFGLDGWTRALSNVERSAFLTGGTDTGFRADLDFVCQAKSFGKLHDGGYGNGRHSAPKTGSVHKVAAHVTRNMRPAPEAM
jgi:hypothetical protein